MVIPATMISGLAGMSLNCFTNRNVGQWFLSTAAAGLVQLRLSGMFVWALDLEKHHRGSLVVSSPPNIAPRNHRSCGNIVKEKIDIMPAVTLHSAHACNWIFIRWNSVDFEWTACTSQSSMIRRSIQREQRGQRASYQWSFQIKAIPS